MECRLKDITVYYESFGEGRPLIALHGWPLDHHHMVSAQEPVFEHRQGWKRIYPDLPPVGYRDAWGILENYPRGTFVSLDPAGHFLEIEQQDLFRVLVSEWLDRVEEHASGVK
jgi:hypothetical protein